MGLCAIRLRSVIDNVVTAVVNLFVQPVGVNHLVPYKGLLSSFLKAENITLVIAERDQYRGPCFFADTG